MNLSETITDKIQQEHRVSKERCVWFVDNHEAVYVELERQLSCRNPRKAAARELTPINTGAKVLERHRESQLECQLSSRIPSQAAGREQMPISYHTSDCEGHVDSQEVSQENNRSFDYSQAAFTRALGLLDDDPPSPADSQELTRGLAQERAVSPSLADRLSRSLDESQEVQAPAGPNILLHNDAGLHDEDGEDGV